VDVAEATPISGSDHDEIASRCKGLDDSQHAFLEAFFNARLKGV